MTKTLIGKILAVAVAVCSVLFMGFAFASWHGGPRWLKFTQGEEFNAYRITYKGGENPVWVATRGKDESQVASNRVLPSVIAKVMDDIQQGRQQELNSLRDAEPKLKAKAERLRETITKDEPALQAKIDFLSKHLEATRQNAADVAVKVGVATDEAQKLENQTSSRRDDVFRLERQVDELRADQFRLEQIRQQLEDQLRQVEGDLDRAQERHAELAQ